MIEKDLLRIALIVLFTAFALIARYRIKASRANQPTAEKTGIEQDQKEKLSRNDWVQRQQERLSSRG